MNLSQFEQKYVGKDLVNNKGGKLRLSTSGQMYLTKPGFKDPSGAGDYTLDFVNGDTIYLITDTVTFLVQTFVNGFDLISGETIVHRFTLPD
jgi:hypothetical protein